jgi:hypothetical protein
MDAVSERDVVLDVEVVQAITLVFGGLIRERAVAGRPTPTGILGLYRLLDVAVQCVSSRRQREVLRREQSEVSRIGSKQAAAILGWEIRRVQRHTADLDGELVGDRWRYDERTVREYAKALQHCRGEEAA